MRNPMILVVPILMSLTACASMHRLTDQEKLALYSGHAGTPVKSILYSNPIGWEKIDDDHLLLNMRPTQAYLLRLSGPCLVGETPTIQISTQTSQLSAGFDSITMPRAPFQCRIDEIRPVDAAAARASRRNMESKK